jgi:hypothetical protein
LQPTINPATSKTLAAIQPNLLICFIKIKSFADCQPNSDESETGGQV